MCMHLLPVFVPEGELRRCAWVTVLGVVVVQLQRNRRLDANSGGHAQPQLLSSVSQVACDSVRHAGPKPKPKPSTSTIKKNEEQRGPWPWLLYSSPRNTHARASGHRHRLYQQLQNSWHWRVCIHNHNPKPHSSKLLITLHPALQCGCGSSMPVPHATCPLPSVCIEHQEPRAYGRPRARVYVH
jgi:hypothetical protein